MNIPDYLVQNVAWLVIATGGSSVGIAGGTFLWRWWTARRTRRLSKGTPWAETRRKDDGLLVHYLERQDALTTRFLDAYEKHTTEMAMLRSDFNAHTKAMQDNLVNCREACTIMHRRVDDVLKAGGAPA